MKNLLFFTFFIAFSTTLTAQIPSLKSNDLKKSAISNVSKEGSSQKDKIEKALMMNEGLQKETISHLKSNPKTATAVIDMVKGNKGSTSGVMKSILGDKDLSTAAIDYISNNPKLLSKAMKLVGM
jgi:hypothetical protein